jgi:hypothetical protein
MRKLPTALAPAVVALGLCCGPAAAHSLDDEARAHAHNVYATKIMPCGASHYTWHPAQHLVRQYAGLTIVVRSVPVTELDQAEGIEWKGGAFISAKAHRQYLEATAAHWDPWRPGPLSAYELPMRKTRGQWIVYPVREVPWAWDALRPIACASIPP